jgi:uncharacterized protein YodC (DUF2158 family)
MNNETKQFFLPGDVVTLRQNIPNKPTMYVVKKMVKSIKLDSIKNDFFQGILCRWYTTNGEIQEAVYNTKDLIKL